jgi:hypothetical protein
MVMDYWAAGWYRTLFSARRQTVVLFPCVGGLPDFYLVPEEEDLESMNLGCPKSAGLGKIVEVVNPKSDNPTLIRGKDERAVRELFSSKRVEQLGNLSGWTIECRAGQLLVYRRWQTMAADELPHLLRRASDFVSTLTVADLTLARERRSEAIQSAPAPQAKSDSLENDQSIRSANDRLTTFDRRPPGTEGRGPSLLPDEERE